MIQRFVRRGVSACILAGGLALGAWSDDAVAGDRRMLLVTDGSCRTAHGSFDNEEILSVVPGRDSEVTPLLRDTNWPALLGDQNHDGRLDDVVSEVDALEVADPTIADPSIFDLVLSIRVDRVFVDGTHVRDGDAFMLLPGGGARIVISERQFEMWAGTSDDVDLDALAFLADGSVAFSFDEPVGCADPNIVSRNGGNAIIGDDAIFVHRPGQSRAELWKTGGEIVALVNHVLGTGYRSVLGVQGLAEDPTHPGEMIFSTGIFTGAGSSTLFTTAGAGAFATLNGRALSASAFGFLDPEDVGDFAIAGTALTGPSVSLAAAKTEPSASADRVVSLSVVGVPFESVRLLVSYGSTALPQPQRNATFGEAGYLFLNANDSLFNRTASSSRLSFVLDETGHLDVALPIRPRAPIGAILLFQARSESRGEASYPVAIRLMP
ncbi:MAG: hypothetical protein HYR85_12185 [Planctomycetes bacterium]|nr:hypothetical protein [Planctomycetota bacterium]MBI3844615.1 hypothetical protein [Planctomycetota bacterium]